MKTLIAAIVFCFPAFACYEVHVAMSLVSYGVEKKTLGPEVEVRREGFLQVSPTHRIHWQESGNPNGAPVAVVHGGPGAGSNPSHRRYFSPETYRIIQISQRGSGASEPRGELNDNTTWDQVRDMEKVREELGIERWHVQGYSWGTTVSLLYAIENPTRVRSIVLRGVFLGRRQDIAALFDAKKFSKLFPEQWARFAAPCGEQDPFTYYSYQLDSTDPVARRNALVELEAWETFLAFVSMAEKPPMPTYDTVDVQAMSIELNYFRNNVFGVDNYILENAYKLRRIPGVIVQGGSDYVTPPDQAWALYNAWNEPLLGNVNMTLLPGAGHTGADPRVTDALVRAAAAVAHLP